jgi:pyruvate formate lyase activating enzyme
MQEALLWRPRSENRVHCHLCSHYCLIPDGGRGKCGVRENRGGTLYTLVNDRIAALNVDPVEKKPLFHFMPGTRTLSYATMGCNLACSFCQNYSLSQPPGRGGAIEGEHATPEQLVDAAARKGCRSISATYSEPTIFFELMLPTARLAHAKGLKNIIVSNGFMTRECLDELGPHIDAANIDLKAFTPEFYKRECHARLEPVKKNLIRIRELGWWLEVTTLVIPGLNDSREELANIAGFIAGELGRDVPWHVSRFHPDFELTDRGATPVATLEAAWAEGRKAGLHYVYVGNVHGHDGESTLCPGCGAPAVLRSGFHVLEKHVAGGACTRCGARIHGVDMS